MELSVKGGIIGGLIAIAVSGILDVYGIHSFLLGMFLGVAGALGGAFALRTKL